MTCPSGRSAPGSSRGRALATFSGRVLAAVLFAAPAFAGSYAFTDTTRFTATGTIEAGDELSSGGALVNKLEGFGDWVTWEHRFAFNPPAAEVLAGTLALSLRDDWDRCYRYEFGLLRGEDGLWAWGEVDTGVYDFGVDAASLSDGIYRVTLASLGGDFFIDRSDLTVTYNAVPVPGAGLLFASGLLGAGWWRRGAAA